MNPKCEHVWEECNLECLSFANEGPCPHGLLHIDPQRADFLIPQDMWLCRSCHRWLNEIVVIVKDGMTHTFLNYDGCNGHVN